MYHISVFATNLMPIKIKHAKLMCMLITVCYQTKTTQKTKYFFKFLCKICIMKTPPSLKIYGTCKYKSIFI